MKKKNVFLAKVFAVALAASMAFSTPYASAALVTETTTYEGSGNKVCTQSSGFFADHGDFYKLSGDFDVTFELTNKSDGGAAWDNFVAVISTAIDYVETRVDNGVTPGYSEYMVMRADGYGWNAEGNTNDGVVGKVDSDWDRSDTTAFTYAMMDAKVTVNATRSGNDFTFKMSCLGSDNVTYTSTFTFTAQAEEDVNIFFTGEKADVNVISYTINSGNAASDNNTVTDTTGDAITTTDSAIDTTPTTPDTDTTAPAPDNNTVPTTPETEVGNDDQQDVSEPSDDADDTDDEDEATVKAAKLNKKKATVKVGKSVKLKVKNTSKKVTWSSSNKKVAKVSKAGKVTGVKAGKATIKAKVGGKTLKCKVTVK